MVYTFDSQRSLPAVRAVLTRAGDGLGNLEAALQAAGMGTLSLPLTQIRVLPTPLPLLDQTPDWLVATSRHGLQLGLEALAASQPHWQSLPWLVVGPATADYARTLGVSVGFLPKPPYEAASAARQWVRQAGLAPAQTLLWPCSQLAPDTMSQVLQEAGHQPVRWPVYTSEPLSGWPVAFNETLEGFEPTVVILTSPTAAAVWCNHAPEFMRGVPLVVIGPRTFGVLSRVWESSPIWMAAEATTAGIVDVLKKFNP